MNRSVPSVLFVEDDIDLRDELVTYIADSGYFVRGVGSVQEAEAALADPYDLLVLDINLPDGSGLELCHRLRPYIRSGIIMCTGRSERELRIDGLKNGADAYLVKPVDPEELEATLASVLRRVTNTKVLGGMATHLLPMPWRLDCKRQVLLAPTGRLIELSAGAALLIRSILKAPNQQISRDELLACFEADDLPTDRHRLEVLVSRLRRKVFDAVGLQLPLQSVYGKGYIFIDYALVIESSNPEKNS